MMRVLLASALTLAWSGCIAQTEQAPVYHLTYTLHDMSDGEEHRVSPRGEHCATARLRPDAVEVYDGVFERIRGAAAYAFVDPAWQGNWATVGDEPFLMALPGRIGSNDVDETMILMELVQGRLRIDGQEVPELPHLWTKAATDGSWRLDAAMDEAPGTIRIVPDPRYGCD